MKVIILHGWAYDTAKWQPLLQELRAAQVDFKMPPIPGLTQKINQPWTIDDYMQWLDEQIEAGPAVLIGHSNGGRLALNYALRFPEKVQQLILIDSAGIARTELSSRLKRFIFKVLAKSGKVLTKSTAARRLLYKVARARDYLQADPIARATMVNLLQSDYALKLEQVQAPVYIIWGRQDNMTPLKDAYTLEKRLAHAQQPFVIDAARHGPQFSHYTEVAAYIVRALTSESQP